MATSAASAGSTTSAAPAARAWSSALDRPALLFAAALSLGAALVHLEVLPEHWEDWWLHGLFFLATGVGQALYAPVLLRLPTVPVVALGIVGNLLIVAAYVWSRTNGVPWGPHAGQPEDVGIGDFMTTAGEVVLVLLLIGHLGPRASRWTMTAMMLLGAGAWALRFTNTLL